jgi:hypothetical protein
MVATGRSAVLRRAGSFLSLLAFEVAAVVLLTRLASVPELRIPWHSLTPWLLNSPVEDVLAAILRSIALLIAWWLLGSNLLYLVASLTRVPSAIRAVRWLTLPVVRRATDHALALTLATSLMSAGTGTAVAATAPVVAMAPQRPGPVAAEHQPHAEATGPFGDAPNPAGPPREQAPARATGAAGYLPRAAGLPARQQPEPGPGQPGYVPRPAGHPPVAQPTPTSTSSTGTSTPTSTTEQRPSTTTPPSTTAPASTNPSSTIAAPSTTGYVPRPAGPPSTASPPRATTPPRSATPTTRSPATTATTATTPPSTTGPPGGGNRGPVPTPVPTPVTPPSPTPPSPPSPPEGQARSHRVAQGENLWTISRDHLAAATNRRSVDLSDHEIATYWLRVIAVNRGSLRSGNPDLIFPGELIMFPPVSGGS